MSLNEIVENVYKPWLNPSVNSIRIDGDWTYHESEKTSGDNLVLDSNLVARWTTLPGNTPYGNGIAVRPAAQNVSSITAPLILNYLAPFSPLFNFNNGDNHITIVEPGTYLVYANVTYHNNVANSFFMEMQLQTTGTNFPAVAGSKIRSFPGTTVFSTSDPLYQYTCVCSASLIKTIAPNRQLRLVCATSSSGNAIDSQYSTLTVIRVSSVA